MTEDAVFNTGSFKSQKDNVLGRLGDMRKSDPKLYEALKLMVEGLDHVTLQLNPIVEVAKRAAAAQALPPPVIAFGYTLTTTAVLLSWTAPSPLGSTVFYEIRTGGTGWDDATFVLRTPSLSAALNPLTIGNHTYRLKTVNGLGDESTDSISTVVTVPALGTPVVGAQVIDNNVLLTWTEPTSSFTVDEYIIYKDAVEIGRLSGLFISIFETSSGTFIYGVVAVDIAGNESVEGQVEAAVDEPPDFELLSSQSIPLDTGTHTNTYYESDGKIYGPVNLAESFEDHFTTAPGGSGGPWASPQEQVDDGQDLFIQENVATGNWVSVEIDLGAELSNVIANLSVVQETLDTTTAPNFTLAMKGGTVPGGGAFVNGPSQFFVAVRYISIRITIAAVGADLDSMGRFGNVILAMNVKFVIDGNVIDCLAADAAGTQVDIPGVAANGHGTKTFVDVDSITLAPIETNNMAVTCNYDFVDAPDPTEFFILCFDAAGRRVDATVSWKVRGIKA